MVGPTVPMSASRRPTPPRPRIGPSNVRRTVRALEVAEPCRATVLGLRRRVGRVRTATGPRRGHLGLRSAPERGSRPGDRDARTRQLDEVRTLVERGFGSVAHVRPGHRVRWLARHLAGARTLDEAIVGTVKRTRALARRQLASSGGTPGSAGSRPGRPGRSRSSRTSRRTCRGAPGRPRMDGPVLGTPRDGQRLRPDRGRRRPVRARDEAARRLCDRRFGIGADGVIRSRRRRCRLLHGSPQLGRQPGPDVRQRSGASPARLRPRPDRTHRGPRRHALGRQDAVVARRGRVSSARSPWAWGRRGSRAAHCRWPATAETFVGEPFEVDEAQLQGDGRLDGEPAPGAVRRGLRATSMCHASGRWSNDDGLTHERRVRRGPGDGVKVRVWERVPARRWRAGPGRAPRSWPRTRRAWFRGRPRGSRGLLQIERLPDDEVLPGPAVRVAEGVLDARWLEASGR